MPAPGLIKFETNPRIHKQNFPTRTFFSTILLLCSILLGMKRFTNYRGETIKLENATLEHINTVHSEIEVADIRATLEDPEEVRSSTRSNSSELYYLLKRKNRFTCVIVKCCSDGNFISTALTTSKPKVGKIIYRRKG